MGSIDKREKGRCVQTNERQKGRCFQTDKRQKWRWILVFLLFFGFRFPQVLCIISTSINGTMRRERDDAAATTAAATAAAALEASASAAAAVASGLANAAAEASSWLRYLQGQAALRHRTSLHHSSNTSLRAITSPLPPACLFVFIPLNSIIVCFVLFFHLFSKRFDLVVLRNLTRELPSRQI